MMAAIEASRVGELPKQLASIWASAGAIGTPAFMYDGAPHVNPPFGVAAMALCWLAVPLGTLVVLRRAGRSVPLLHAAGLFLTWIAAALILVFAVRVYEGLIAVPIAIVVGGALIGSANRLMLRPAHEYWIQSLAIGVSWGALFVFAAVVWLYGYYVTLAFGRFLYAASALLAAAMGGLVAGGLGWTGSRFLAAKSPHS